MHTYSANGFIEFKEPLTDEEKKEPTTIAKKCNCDYDIKKETENNTAMKSKRIPMNYLTKQTEELNKISGHKFYVEYMENMAFLYDEKAKAIGAYISPCICCGNIRDVYTAVYALKFTYAYNNDNKNDPFNKKYDYDYEKEKEQDDKIASENITQNYLQQKVHELHNLSGHAFNITKDGKDTCLYDASLPPIDGVEKHYICRGNKRSVYTAIYALMFTYAHNSEILTDITDDTKKN